jgi:molybdopterin-synthase adenylyltransferase
VGHLIIADADRVDLTNLQRQIVHTTGRVGWLKVESAKATIQAINPTCNVEVLPKRLEGADLQDAVKRATVVLDCSDNFMTRHAVNRACVEQRIPLVSGSGVRWDGQITVFDSRQETSPCYHCLFPQDPNFEDERCGLMGVFAPLTGTIGVLQAAQALQLIGQFGDPAVGRLILVDSMGTRFTEMHISRDPDCKVCSPARDQRFKNL